MEVNALHTEAASARAAAEASQADSTLAAAKLSPQAIAHMQRQLVSLLSYYICCGGWQVEMMQMEVDAMQAEAASARAAAESSQAAVTEVERLGQDNALLAARLAQMDVDLQVVPQTSNLNIQYALEACCLSCFQCRGQNNALLAARLAQIDIDLQVPPQPSA